MLDSPRDFRLTKHCRCKKCKGAKVVKEKKRVEFKIEPGTEDGERIALKGEGDEAVCPAVCWPVCDLNLTKLSPKSQLET